MQQRESDTIDTREGARQLMDRVREHIERNELEAALAVFAGLHPSDQADTLADLDAGPRETLLRALEPEESARILEKMEVEDAAEVFGEMEAPALSDILDETRPDVAADLLKQLPEERSQETLEEMEESEEVASLLEYADDTAGGRMSLEYVSAREDMSAALALDRVRILEPKVEGSGSVFIVDGEGRLVGSLSVVGLALARPTILVRDIMDTEVVSVPAETDQEECAHLMERYDLKHLPVVDHQRRLIGIILVEDLVDVLEEEATEDMHNIAGIGRERLFGPLPSSIRRRLPWLYVNLATTILAALVIDLFQSTITQVVVLTVFLPVVAGQGGIGGTQTLTLVIRGIALGDVPERRALRLLSREVVLGIIHGVLLGTVIGLIAYLWKGNEMLGVVLGVAMVGNIMVAGLAGAATPLALRVFGLDPALGSAVIVTTITDVVGFLLFLGIATALVGYLM